MSRREGESRRESVYYTERWMGENVDRALEMQGCKTDQQKSAMRGRWLAAAAAGVIEAGRLRDSPPEHADGLLLLSPPEEVRQEELNWGPAVSKAPPVAVTEDLPPPREASRHKPSVW